MNFKGISREVLQRRLASGLTQAELAERAGLSRATVNAIENDSVSDIGIRKLADLLGELNVGLAIAPMDRKRGPDFLKMGAISAGVSFREKLSVNELTRILISGRVPKAKRPHVRALLEEAPKSVLRGLYKQLALAVSSDRLRVRLIRVGPRQHLDPPNDEPRNRPIQILRRPILGPIRAL